MSGNDFLLPVATRIDLNTAIDSAHAAAGDRIARYVGGRAGRTGRGAGQSPVARDPD
ncbi:MAG TPA: hypothetical protein VLW65_21595 [Bryobacteraceae bacterium]|nr:hypothetical protein [Bryobacteraceae bacterium]